MLPGCTLIGKLVPLAAISVAMESDEASHPSLGDAGQQLDLGHLLFPYSHVFPAPGDASYRPD